MNGRRPEFSFKIAMLWRGDAEACHTATPQNNRFHRISGPDAEPFQALRAEW